MDILCANARGPRRARAAAPLGREWASPAGVPPVSRRIFSMAPSLACVRLGGGPDDGAEVSGARSC